MKNFMRLLSLTLLSSCIGLSAIAQNVVKPVEKMVNQKLSNNLGRTQKADLFSIDPQTAQKSVLITKDLKEKTLLKLDNKMSGQLLATSPEILEMTLPYGGQSLELQLVKQDVTAFGFTVVTDKSNGEPVSYQSGVHYRGIVKNMSNSVVAISVFDDEVMGLINTDEGNLNLGKLAGLSDTYVLYNEKNLSGKKASACETPEMPAGYVVKESNVSADKATVKCVKVYLETDYELFTNKGSTTAVTNYITGLFNQIATLYQNESITTQISQLFVWTSNDPYSGSSSSSYLTAFRNTRTTFNGDIAHLVNLTGNLGGVAYVDVICNKSYGYAFSCINPTYSNVPTYSWSVEVFTHEMGHNLGSPHTQSCSWTGGALDNCYTTEGGCPAGPAPTNGGTIMSYCHLTSTGINFNNGFGPQPGNLIRSRVSNASCLGTCETGGPVVCNVPGSVGASSVSQTGFTISWSAVSGAATYDVRYKAASSSTWINSSTAATSLAVTGLTANTAYQFEVRSNCGSGNVSAYSATGSVTTAPAPVPYCASKGNSVSGEWIANVTIGSINNTTTGNAGYGNFTAKSTSAASGASVSFSLKPGFPTGGFLGLTTQTKPESWRVWVDFNKDGDFVDAGEQVYSSTASSTGTITGSFVVPSGTATGSTRIRVSMKRNSVASPCETFANGEVEDYTLVITAASPSGKTAPTIVTATTAQLSSNIYPNPSAGAVSLDLAIPANSGKVEMNVLDLNGKIVQSFNWESSTTDQTITHQIDMSTQPKGIYMISINSASGSRSISKLIVQ